MTKFTRKRNYSRRRKLRSSRRVLKGGFDLNSALNAPGNWISDNIDRALAGGGKRKRKRKTKSRRRRIKK